MTIVTTSASPAPAARQPIAQSREPEAREETPVDACPEHPTREAGASPEAPERHLRLVPDTEPVQLRLAYEYDVAPGVPAIPPPPPHLHLVPSAPPATPAGPPLLPSPRAWAGQLARAIGEVALGERPAAQLSMHIAPEPLRRLTRRGHAVSRHPSARSRRGAGRLQRVGTVRVCPISAGIVEVSVVLVSEHRAQAVAMRLEAVGSRWVATAVDLI